MVGWRDVKKCVVNYFLLPLCFHFSTFVYVLKDISTVVFLYVLIKTVVQKGSRKKFLLCGFLLLGKTLYGSFSCEENFCWPFKLKT